MKQGQSFAQINIVKNFGDRSNSFGMELVLFSENTSIAQVLASEEYFLNPCAQWGPEGRYGLKGTLDQYQKFYKAQVECLAASADVKKFGDDWSDPHAHSEFQRDFIQNFKPWWEQGIELKVEYKTHITLSEIHKGERKVVLEDYVTKGMLDAAVHDIFMDLFRCHSKDPEKYIEYSWGWMKVRSDTEEVIYSLDVN